MLPTGNIGLVDVALDEYFTRLLKVMTILSVDYGMCTRLNHSFRASFIPTRCLICRLNLQMISVIFTLC